MYAVTAAHSVETSEERAAARMRSIIIFYTAQAEYALDADALKGAPSPSPSPSHPLFTNHHHHLHSPPRNVV
jgi:hypothetical protein